MKSKLIKAGADLRRKQANPLPVMEQFYTLQGEGIWTGTPAYFIRLAGCDVGCHWCDVKESWHPGDDQYLQIEEIVVRALASGTDRVVITGGEPTIYDLSLLTKQLHEAGLKIHMETAGVHPLIGDIDWVCFSPKKFLKPQPEFYQKASELKVIIFNDHDFPWAEEHAEKCADHVQLFLQPEWSRRNKFTAKIVEYAKANPHWRVSLQTHKYIDIP
ncbi:MAG: 7-carboxy-7-deazaguanine synthase QueE [Bacteroidetes bacterium]|nr:7-carboxy-7-deazaguanine synthase QueE [Bacteroidota bacterium]MCB0843292.1 7-carboxy-7-deazaguanine synthase QueE [Bacteroidota bacterium]